MADRFAFEKGCVVKRRRSVFSCRNCEICLLKKTLILHLDILPLVYNPYTRAGKLIYFTFLT